MLVAWLLELERIFNGCGDADGCERSQMQSLSAALGLEQQCFTCGTRRVSSCRSR